MKFSKRSILVHSFFGAAVLASPTGSSPASINRRDLPLVDVAELKSAVDLGALMGHANKLQGFAERDPAFSRAAGTKAHNETIDYIVKSLEATNSYNVEVHRFSFVYYEGNATFSASGVPYKTFDFEYSPATKGPIAAGLMEVMNLGCDATDFPKSITGKLALISRGDCDFGLKVALAGAAGAAGAVIYNNEPGPIGLSTFVEPSRPEGPYVPAGSISGEDGASLLKRMANSTVLGSLLVHSVVEDRHTANVIATTLGGDQNNVILSGGHTDSGPEGPGINDSGSAIAANLEVALSLAKYSVTNAVRFCFWSAEYFGLLGSHLYVANISNEELAKIALYLSIDEIASPNFGYFVYGGGGSNSNQTMPLGSDKIEGLFKEYYKSADIESAPTPFDGTSDYVPFAEVMVPVGGIFSGTLGVKTNKQAAQWGGVAQEPFDPNYFTANDVVANLDGGAFVQNTKAVAHAVGTYALSTQSLLSKKGRRNAGNGDRPLVARRQGKKAAVSK